MKRLIHFFSLAVMTQVILMLSQLVLLPIQVRMWGQSATAFWYSALALATITYVVDCGLRTAGHTELLKANADPDVYLSEVSQFSQIWSWIRVLILIVTIGLIFCDAGANLVLGHGNYPAWRVMLIAACSLETVLIVRITYLDTLGRYRGAEASYFFFAMLRLILSIIALVWFHWNAPGLAAVYLVTAAIAVTAQGQFLCRSNSLLRLTACFPKLSWRVLALARFTVAEPLSNWTRLSLPVLVIGHIATPIAVTTYVALRAVFGAGRTTIQQLARVASVEFLKSKDEKRAESLLTIFVIIAVLSGSALSFFVVIDNMRVLGLWLKHFDHDLFQHIALTFALTAPFLAYQIPMNLMFRTGQLQFVATRHYAFVLYSLLFASLSLALNSLAGYLALLVVAETVLSWSFLASSKTGANPGHSGAGRVGIRVPVAASLIVGVLWSIVRRSVAESLNSFGLWPIASSGIILALLLVSMWAVLYRCYGRHLRLLRKPLPSEPLLAVAK